MSLPEIKFGIKCVERSSCRRLLIGVTVALITLTSGVWLSGYVRGPKVVRSSFSTTIVKSELVGVPFSDGPVTHTYDLFPSPDGAAEAFELQIREAGGYRGLRHCHDQEGNELGKQVLLMNPPARQGGKADWRIIWALRGWNSSELFSVQSDSLQQLQAVERFAQPNWKVCL